VEDVLLHNSSSIGFLETFKQVINKLSTNKTSPLPLFFPTPESMDLISKNKQTLKQVFQAFDTRSLGRVDGCELYCAFMLLSKGPYEIFLKTIIEVFGF
jgi:Ca2+-binding EF-hand superfamily protein